MRVFSGSFLFTTDLKKLIEIMVAEEVFVNNYPHPEPDEIFSAGPIPVPLGRYRVRK
jgi:hypothetical protein